MFANRDVLALIVGYAATIWGTAGLRQWIVVFLGFCVANRGGGSTQGWSMLTVGALVGLLGVPAGLCGNEVSLRLGLRATATGVFLVSALVNALFGFAAILPYGVIVGLAMAAGFIVQAISPISPRVCSRSLSRWHQRLLVRWWHSRHSQITTACSDRRPTGKPR